MKTETERKLLESKLCVLNNCHLNGKETKKRIIIKTRLDHTVVWMVIEEKKKKKKCCRFLPFSILTNISPSHTPQSHHQ